MDNFLSCTLCMNKFDTQSHLPLILQCGHTFCSTCISNIIEHFKREQSFPFLPCPLDNSIGSQHLDISFIPVNKVIIDMIDFSGQSLSSLNLKDNTINTFNNLSFLDSYYERLLQLQKKFNESYDIIYSTINNVSNQRKEINKGLEEIYNNILSKIVGEKNKVERSINDFIEKRLKEMKEINAIVERNKNIVNINVKKIKAMKEQNYKKVTISDQLMLINELNMEVVDDKKNNERIERIIWEIANDKISPKVIVKNDIQITLEKLVRCITVSFPDDVNEEYTNQILLSEDPSKENICTLSQLNFSFSSLRLNPEFIWFQPNSNCIFKYDSNQKWTLLPNKTNHLFTEMFRVCPISNFAYIITGGVLNFLSSNETYYYHISSEIVKKQDMINPRRAHGTVLLRDYVYVCGGINSESLSIQSCERYSIDQNKWEPIADLPSCKSHVTLCAVNNNKILSFGGDNNENITNTIDLYEYDKDIWLQLSITLPYYIECPCVCNIDNTNVMICGGYSPDKGAISNVICFNTETFQIDTQFKPLDMKGWSIYMSFFHMGKMHMFFGGESSNPPIYYDYEISYNKNS